MGSLASCPWDYKCSIVLLTTFCKGPRVSLAHHLGVDQVATSYFLEKKKTRNLEEERALHNGVQTNRAHLKPESTTVAPRVASGGAVN